MVAAANMVEIAALVGDIGRFERNRCGLLGLASFRVVAKDAILF